MGDTTITARCRNNGDARKLCAGEIAIPGAITATHIYGRSIEIKSSDLTVTLAWLVTANEVDSYMTLP